MEQLDFAHLKEKQRRLRDGFPDDVSLRIHRALSWGRRAEQEEEDLDARFIFLWIGFNAAYARDPDAAENEGNMEEARAEFQRYFETLDSCDGEQWIHRAVWERYPNEIRVLVGNEYVFAPFWKHHNRIPGYDDWQRSLHDSQKVIGTAFAKQETPKILSVLFDRLYVLRNQLMHGGATWGSEVNREQLRDGVKILGWLLPIFIDIMLDHPREDWGPPWYPVIQP